MSIIEVVRRKPSKAELLRSKIFNDIKFGLFVSIALAVIILILVIFAIFVFYFAKNLMLHMRG